LFLLFSFYFLPAQVVKSEQMDRDTQARVKNIILTNHISKFLNDGYFSFERYSIGNVFHFLSFNPIEGTRLRFGGKVNLYQNPTHKMRKLTISGFAAYGIKDKRLKWETSATNSFLLRPLGENQITFSISDNTFLPFMDEYDHILLSTNNKKDFFLYLRQCISLAVSQNVDFIWGRLNFKSSLSYNRIFDYKNTVLNENYQTFLQTNTENNAKYTSFDFAISLTKGDNITEKNVIVSRFPLLYNTFSVDYGCDFWNNIHHRLKILSQFRISLNDYNYGTLDFHFETSLISLRKSYLQNLYPLTQIGYVAGGYGFLLLPFQSYGSSAFLSGVLQYNSGGNLLNLIPFFRKFHVNEFTSCKFLLSNYKPYYEISAGIDNIFDLLGFEIAYNSLNKWGFFLRLKISDF
jgi:hypothetical protein